MIKQENKIITISMPADLLAWIDRTADEELRSRSNQICRLLNYVRTDILNEEYTKYDEDKTELRKRSAIKYDIADTPTIGPEQRWIPVTERLPEDIRPVIVTWENTDPAPYYRYILGKHFTGTACYKDGKWYWYSIITEDMLSENGQYDSEEFDEEFDEAIECIAWMPLPEPWKGEEGTLE